MIRPSFRSLCVCSFMALTLLLVSSSSAGLSQEATNPPQGNQEKAELAPTGLFMHAFTGTTAGTEWALVHEEAGGIYRLTDFLGNGIRFRLIDGQAIQMVNDGQGGSGGGKYTSSDAAQFDWHNWQMSFHSRIWRAPGTDAALRDVTRTLDSGDTTLAGTWQVTVEEISPTTGAAMNKEESTAQLSVDGNTLRIDWADGAHDQGVFVAADRVTFQVWLAGPKSGRYATPRGCSTSRDVDLLGTARIVSGQEIVLTLALQTRDKVGDQKQQLFRYLLTRQK